MAIPTLTNRWAVLALLFLLRMVMAMQFQSVPPLAPFLARDLGLTFGQIGTLIGVYMFPGVLLALPGVLLGQYASITVFPPLAGRLVDTAHDARAALYLAAALLGMTCVALGALRMLQRYLRPRGATGAA